VLESAERIPAGKAGHIGRDGIWAIRLLTLTGMRRDEVRDLKWEEVDWRQGLLRLPDSKTVAAGVPVTASGLYTIHAAAILLETGTPDTSPGSLVALVRDDARRATIQARLVREGLRDSDLRMLSEAAGLFLGRATKLDDFDPFEPISDRILTMLRVGATHAGRVQRRFVLLLDRCGDRITIADPGGQGLVTMTRRMLDAARKNGASKGALWLGTLGRDERAQT